MPINLDSAMQTDVSVTMQKIIEEAKKRGTNLTRLAIDAGLGRDTLTLAARRGTTPSTSSLNKIAKLWHIGIDTLLPGETPVDAPLFGEVRRASVKVVKDHVYPQDLPVRGTAAGSTLTGFRFTPEVIRYVRRAPALVGVDAAYALEVTGASMAPLHRPSDLIFVHPHWGPKPGDSVIVLTRTHEKAPIEAFIKTFEAETPDTLTVSQLNPKAEITINKNVIIGVHKVLTMRDLFGL